MDMVIASPDCFLSFYPATFGNVREKIKIFRFFFVSTL